MALERGWQQVEVEAVAEARGPPEDTVILGQHVCRLAWQSHPRITRQSRHRHRVSHAAKGGEDAQLFIDPVFTLDDACNVRAGCWGVLEGDVSPNARWEVFFSPMGTTNPFTSGTADNSGTVIVNLNLPCGQGSTSAYVVDMADGLTTQPVEPPEGC